MIKIAVLGTRGFPGIQGGVENHCENLYTHLVKIDCSITVFTRVPYTSPAPYQYNGVELIPVTCPQNKFLEAIVHSLKSVIKSRKLKPDILHIHAIGPSLFTPLAKFLGMKVVVTHHGPDYERKKWPLTAKIFLKFCERMGMYFADEVITITKNIADNIEKKYGRNSTVIPNGVNIPRLAETEQYIREYGLVKRRYILAVGRFVPEKGFHDLIDAFIIGNYNNWKLVIVGDTDHEDEYSRELKVKASKNKNIVLTGFITGQPLKELYSNSGLFVLPSYYEGLPIVLLEAMSYGLSCIVSDIPANRNVELDNDRFFPAGDKRLISEKIKEYIVNPWISEHKHHQINMIDEEYSWKNIAEETLKSYMKVLEID